MSAIEQFQDLSGIKATSADPNPYNALLEACQKDPAQIRARYDLHRTARAKQQRDILLSSNFQGVKPDPILRSLLDEEARSAAEKTGYVDPRHCLVFWARPPERVRKLVEQVQERLRAVVPNMWFMPRTNLHLTVLELAHSLTPSALESLAAAFAPLVAPATDHLHDHAAAAQSQGSDRRAATAFLSHPMVTFDASAVAVSFLPDGGKDRPYTYHHLRRDMWDLCSSSSKANLSQARGVEVASRYVVPSCHLTVGRFVSHDDTGGAGGVDAEKMRKFVGAIDEINAWLEREYWGDAANPTGKSEADGSDNSTAASGMAWTPGAWTVGEEVGLTLRRGTVWYGGGKSVRVGKAIADEP